MKHIYTLLIFILFSLSIVTTGSALSIPEEKQVAKKFMKMIHDNQMILKDPVAQQMVTEVGNQILSLLPTQPFEYGFYVVDDDVFNAFASPAANIFFYRGLITSLDSIDELAGIMAHEIAHATSRHVSQSIDRSTYVNLGTLAGILAGILVGTQSDGQTGAAVIQSSMALGHTAMLAFTRENETEADEKGIGFLKKSCYSPLGLLTGLMKIRASDFRGVEAIPEYVKTHPGTGNRIAHAESILSELELAEKKTPCRHTYDFTMVKYRLLGLYADIDSTFNQLVQELQKDPENPAIHYGIGLLYNRKLMRGKAIDHLTKALLTHPFDPMIRIEMGRIYIENESPEKALNLLEGIESDPVLGLRAKFYQAEAQLETGYLLNAKELFSQVIEKAPDDYPKAYHHLANILSQQKNPGLSHYYLGVYYKAERVPKTAKIHLQKAIETLDTPEDIKRAEKLLLELEKKYPNKGPATKH